MITSGYKHSRVNWLENWFCSPVSCPATSSWESVVSNFASIIPVVDVEHYSLFEIEESTVGSSQFCLLLYILIRRVLPDFLHWYPAKSKGQSCLLWLHQNEYCLCLILELFLIRYMVHIHTLGCRTYHIEKAILLMVISSPLMGQWQLLTLQKLVSWPEMRKGVFTNRWFDYLFCLREVKGRRFKVRLTMDKWKALKCKPRPR